MFDPQDFASALKELRGSRTQKEVAERAGLDPATWSAYERGSRVPRPERLEQVARGLGIDVVSLQAAVLERSTRRLADATIRNLARTIQSEIPEHDALSTQARAESVETRKFLEERVASISREVVELLLFLMRGKFFMG